MRMIQHIQSLLKYLFLIGLSCVEAQTINTTLNSEIRDVSELQVGFNRRSDKGNWWTDSTFHDLVEEMNPDIVRYPAGTQANYWDWSTGKFLENTNKEWNDKEILKIPEFLAALPERTKAIYVVNMARPTPATGVSVTASEEILKSQTTLNLKISDMLAALDEFAAQGKLPFAVELGNEFYFGNEESGIFHIVEDTNSGIFYSGWDTVNNQPYESVSKADATVVIAKFYLNQCKDIVAAIKATYPSIKIILTTTKGGYAARESWNNTIFDELEKDPSFSSLKNNTYAVTQHHYIKNDGIQTPITDNASSKVAIAEGIEYPISKQTDYDLVPNDYKIWITEYGATKGIAEETWASAVRYAAFTYGWLELGNKIEQLDWHYISDNNVVNSNDTPMKLAPVGIAVKMFQSAASEMNEMQEISFSINPFSVNAVKSLYGYKFKSEKKETLLIFNTNDTDFLDVNISNLISYTGQPILTKYYSNTPYVNGVYEGHSNIVSSISNVNNSVTIKNFSISVVEILNTSLSDNEIQQKNIKVYPNPVKDILNIKLENSAQSVVVKNLSGVTVYEKEKVYDGEINLSDLRTGIYFININTNEGTVIKKLLKI